MLVVVMEGMVMVCIAEGVASGRRGRINGKVHGQSRCGFSESPGKAFRLKREFGSVARRPEMRCGL